MSVSISWLSGNTLAGQTLLPTLSFKDCSGSVRPQEIDERLATYRFCGGGAEARCEDDIGLNVRRERADQIDAAIGQNCGNEVNHQICFATGACLHNVGNPLRFELGLHFLGNPEAAYSNGNK